MKLASVIGLLLVSCGGSGGTAGPDAALAECTPGFTSEAGQCVAVDHLEVILSQVRLTNTGALSIEYRKSVRLAERNERQYDGVFLYEDGFCFAVQANPADGNTFRSTHGRDCSAMTGTVSVSDGNSSVDIVPCFPSYAEPGATSGAYTVSGTVGGGFGAFEATLELPDALTASSTSPVRGEPAIVSWDSRGAEYVRFFWQYYGTTVLCRVPDTGSFAIPAAITAMIPDSPTVPTLTGTLSLAAVNSESLTVDGSGILVLAESEVVSVPFATSPR